MPIGSMSALQRTRFDAAASPNGVPMATSRQHDRLGEPIDGIVFSQEHGCTRESAYQFRLLTPNMRGLLGLHRLCAREPDSGPERTAHPLLAAKAHITAHKLGQALRNAQAQSGPAILPYR